MKKELLKGFTMLMAVVALALTTAVVSNAQASSKVIASIPFEFSVGYKALPAGEYSLEAIATAGDALLIQSADRKVSVLRLSQATEVMKNKSHARLVFHRYGERYFLAEVWSGTNSTGRQLIKSSEERSIERELASNASTSDQAASTFEIVEVVAVLR